MSRSVNIYLEESPNPNSRKFVLNFLIVPEGYSFDYPDLGTADNSPLAQALFGFSFVERVFFMNNFITLTKSETVDWLEIQTELKDFIKEYFEEDRPVLIQAETNDEVNQEGSEIEMKIRTLLDEYVKPAVEQDGGAIEYHSFNNGVVKVLLQGSCSGCPSSMYTLKAGIENLLKSMIPEVDSVEAEGV
jgi:Fe-S cluster biogenesis protein NfuA